MFPKNSQDKYYFTIHQCYFSNNNENLLDNLGSHYLDINHKDLWVGDSFIINIYFNITFSKFNY